LTRIEPWVYLVEHGIGHDGEPATVWMRQDGLGRWLVTRYYQSSPTFYLTIDGEWSHRAIDDARHTEHTARSLALGYLMGLKAERNSMDGEYPTVPVSLTPLSERALNRTVARGDDSVTTVINRAIQVYENLDGIWKQGGEVMIRRRPGHPIETLKIY
jgi:hypothetical protein